MARVVHFEIHAGEPARAIDFYRRVFGWEFQQWPGGMEYWVVVTGPPDQPGINGGLVRRKGPAPRDGQPVVGYVCTVEVESLDDTLRAVEEAGGPVVVPRMPIPGVGWLAYARDTEGNIVGLMQNDPAAA